MSDSSAEGSKGRGSNGRKESFGVEDSNSYNIIKARSQPAAFEKPFIAQALKIL